MYSTAHPREYPACSGCSLCRLVCPMWRARRDPRFSAEGLARARQCGAAATDLAPVLEACSLCGACDPVCPEKIDLTGMIIGLRRALPRPDIESPVAADAATPDGALLLPGAGLRADPALLDRVGALLGVACAADDGADIAQALESGDDIDSARRRRFLDRLDGRALVAGDGLLAAALRRWLPGARLQGLGEALAGVAAVRRRLTGADFYVIEARAYHADYERLVAYYDRLRAETGCALNLDLQRIAIPAVDEAETRWMLQGRRPARIVVEAPADRAIFARVCDVPVLHLAELAQD
jgi:heterodisulfide reductase subunit C